MATEYAVVAQSMTIILAGFPPFSFGLATADIKAISYPAAQAQSHMVKFAKQASFAQAQAKVV